MFLESIPVKLYGHIWEPMNQKKIIFSDTTLRDGEQMPGASLNPDDKAEIAQALEKAGVKSIEAGFPISSPSEIEGIQKVVKAVHEPVISALCRTLTHDIDAADEALKAAEPLKRCANLFISTSPIHREYKLKKTKSQILDLIGKSIHYAKQKFHIVSFGPEDASRTEPDFLCDIYRIAIEAGATTIGYPDTLGILTPEKVRENIRYLQDNVPGIDKVMLAVHFHNDLGLATANTLAAIETGVHIVQCTVNGIGERAGNTAFEEIVLALLMNPEQYPVKNSIEPTQLTSLSQLVAKKTNIPIGINKPVVGPNIFATEAGIHQDGILKHPDTYIPFKPEMVGADKIELVLGKHSGKAAIVQKIKEIGYELSDVEIDSVISNLKEASKDQWRDAQILLKNTISIIKGK